MTPLTARTLNDTCFCVPVDRQKLHEKLDELSGLPGLGAGLMTTHPHLFASTGTFVAASDLRAMKATVAAIELAAATAPYQSRVLADAPLIARTSFGPHGVVMGYDFHLSEDGPKLIEVNTNAGGLFLNAVVEELRNFCCSDDPESYARRNQYGGFAERIVTMFRTEWSAQRRLKDLRHIAVVDQNPLGQYLYPEFLLVKALLERHGLAVTICGPQALRFDGSRLTVNGAEVDLVYNRLTDFYLEQPDSAALAQAYASGSVVLTPNPHHHALFANKQNLTLLTDPDFVASLGLGEKAEQALHSIARTILVTPDNADLLWAKRRSLFFKPLSGHAGKAVYRGDKLTLGTFETIRHTPYVAQDLVVPGHRSTKVDGNIVEQKMDVRLYTYRGQMLLSAARLYQGQTTNFRTPGGGFAPVFVS